jgi:hypothetical protein
MDIDEVHKFEQTVVKFMNEFQGWDLTWSGGGYDYYDAIGLSPKKRKCCEKYKYDKLMEMDDDLVKLYLVSDPKGTYMFWLDAIEMPEVKELYCPDTTLWTKKKVLKKVYLLTEDMASIVTLE